MNLNLCKLRIKLQLLGFVSAIILLAALGGVLRRQMFAAVPKVHTVTLGPVRKVPYTQPDATPDTKVDETSTMRIRPLFVDDRQKEWTTGDVHDVTDRTFSVRRALRINDSLPGEVAARWIWQPGPCLAVDRLTGHITPLHLPDYDSAVSDVVWFRDYATYCVLPRRQRGDLWPSSPNWERAASPEAHRNEVAADRPLHSGVPTRSMAASADARHPETYGRRGGNV